MLIMESWITAVPRQQVSENKVSLFSNPKSYQQVISIEANDNVANDPLLASGLEVS